jgi:hypothetical protein
MFGAGLIHGSPSQREIKVAVYTAYMLFEISTDTIIYPIYPTYDPSL